MRSAERRWSYLFLLLAAGAIAFAGFTAGREWPQFAWRLGSAGGSPTAETRTVAVRRDLFPLNVFEIPQGSGSGFLWDTEGHVATNCHAVASASSARVTLADRSSWDAEPVGVAPEKDLAVLRIAGRLARRRRQGPARGHRFSNLSFPMASAFLMWPGMSRLHFS